MADILISQLTDGTPSLNDLLIFANPTTGLAKKTTITTFKTSLSLFFADLNNYSVNNLLDDQILYYDSGEWKNIGLKTINGNQLFGSGDIIISGGSGLTSLNTLTASTQTFATSSTGTDFTITSSTSTHTFNLPSASATNRGLLTAANWTTFNSKQAALVSGTNIKTLGGLSLLGSGDYGYSITTTGLTLLFETYSFGALQGINLNIPIASSTIANGLLTNTDWTTFNNKQAALVSGTNIKTVNGSSLLGSGNIVISGGTGLTSLNSLTAGTQLFAVASTGTDFTITSTTDTHTFAIPTASASARGLLSSANWTTFNNKVGYTGATADLNLGVYNLYTNNVFTGFTSVAASGTLITLTVTSTPYYNVTGSGGQIIKLPDATTLINGASFVFNNNQSSGAITVNNNSNTLIASIPSGGYVTITLLLNSIAAGSWDKHFEAPANVSWSTNTFDYAGSITSATWNGAAITDTYINSAATWNGKQTALNGTGFVKISGTTISYDNSTYLTSITSANVTTALGFTPYNSTNPSNFISLTSLSFSAGSGAYNSTTGVITIPTNNSQLTNGAGYLTANQSITLSGDVTGSGATSISTTLATVTQASSGNFVKITLDTKGRVTGNTAVVAADITALGFAVSTITTNRQTASYTLVLADANKLVEMNVATANTLTVPTNATVAFPIGTQILISQYGAGAATITAASGVTLRSESSKLKTNGQYSGATCIKIATDEWYVFGNLIA
jgi:hypothetical protein